MYAWLREHAADERKPKDTEEQFIYKARKKAHRAVQEAAVEHAEAGARARDRPGRSRSGFRFLMQTS